MAENINTGQIKPDAVNHPVHYTSHPSGVEVLDLTREMPFGPGNAIKYILRRDLKGDVVENIDKAIFYLTDSIDNRINYYFTPRLMRKARLLIDAEPDANVVSFVSALCLNGRGPSFYGNEPDYDLARDLCGVLRGYESDE